MILKTTGVDKGGCSFTDNHPGADITDFIRQDCQGIGIPHETDDHVRFQFSETVLKLQDQIQPLQAVIAFSFQKFQKMVQLSMAAAEDRVQIDLREREKAQQAIEGIIGSSDPAKRGLIKQLNDLKIKLNELKADAPAAERNLRDLLETLNNVDPGTAAIQAENILGYEYILNWGDKFSALEYEGQDSEAYDLLIGININDDVLYPDTKALKKALISMAQANKNLRLADAINSVPVTNKTKEDFAAAIKEPRSIFQKMKESALKNSLFFSALVLPVFV